MKSKFVKAFGKKFIAKLILIFAVTVCCCLLSACDPGTYRFTQEDLSDVVSIELIFYDNPDQESFASWVPDHTDDLKPFDAGKQSVLEKLSDDRIPQFVDALCECRILSTYFAFDSPGGVCIKLAYANGDFLIINCKKNSYTGYIGKFSSDGEVAQFVGCFESVDSFEKLVSDYFQTKIK